MKVYAIKEVEQENDWHFLDIVADVYEVGDTNQCCSVCMVRNKQPEDTVRIILPYKFLRSFKVLGIMANKA